MGRLFTSSTLVLASHNQGKLKEIEGLFAPLGLTIRSIAEWDAPEPEEIGTSYEENAIIKALAAARLTGFPALADDSGFEVEALDNKPGLYSARWAGANKDFNIAIERVWDEVKQSKSDSKACRFVCALALSWQDGHSETALGAISGNLVFPPRGNKGFGYDPIFCPHGYVETFAEMEPALKHSISHRAQAFTQLLERCFKAV